MQSRKLASANSCKRIISLLEINPTLHSSRSFRTTPSPHIGVELMAGITASSAWYVGYMEYKPYVTAARATQEERGRLLAAGAAGLFAFTIASFISNAAENNIEMVMFNNIQSETLTNFKYNDSEKNTISIILKLHNIDLNNFKREHPKVICSKLSHDDLRLWIIDKIQAIDKNLKNSTKNPFEKFVDQHDKEIISECFIALGLEPNKKNVFNEKNYRNLMIRFCQQILNRNDEYLKQELGFMSLTR